LEGFEMYPELAWCAIAALALVAATALWLKGM
jgi:hypothetical protein